MSGLPPDKAKRVRELVKVPPVAIELSRLFERAGKSLYLVGGSVRDAVLGRVSRSDLDFATDAKPAQVVELVRGWHEGQWLVGIEFGTVGVQKSGVRLEITTFRSERYPADSRHPEVVPVATIEADLSRRDFTINAMALKLPERTFVDPYGGLEDLAARRLRTPLTPEESFSDDPLRMLRAARFVAQLGVAPEEALLDAMRAQRRRLAIVSAERIRDELMKILSASGASKGLDVAVDTELAEEFLPELPALRLEQDPIHQHKDVYRHTLAVVDKLIASDPDPEDPDVVLRLAGLLHDIGKPATRRYDGGKVSFHHHEVVGAQMAERRLRALRFPNDVVEPVVALVEMHLRFHTFRMGWSDSAVRRYVRDAGPLLDRLNRLVRADCTTRNRFKARQLAAAIDELEERIAHLAAEEDLKRIRPPLDGNDVMQHLGIPPGPTVGKALNHLLELRLDRGEIPREEALHLLEEWAVENGITNPKG
ncbi:MAG: CCA tRNA nucleotidyltransferase [Actinobacteria bacterium]|nr:MAG: CCA tRNA nucleotidyltransferase [Actinomycetota bacterium]